jgi:hypothetical protein
MKKILDHLKRKPSKADIEKAQQAVVEEQQKQADFVSKYNALCEEYGYSIVPQVTVQLAKKQQ